MITYGLQTGRNYLQPRNVETFRFVAKCVITKAIGLYASAESPRGTVNAYRTTVCFWHLFQANNENIKASQHCFHEENPTPSVSIVETVDMSWCCHVSRFTKNDN